LSLYQVSYDIVSDKTRRKVVKVLEGVGNRVQKSVYFCDLDGRASERLEMELTRLLGPADSALIVCVEARSPLRILGVPIQIPDSKAVVVI